MTDKVVLTNLANLQNETTAIGVINANNAAITTAMDNTLSRDGTSPNTMGANLDMNSNHILNLPLAATANEPLRLQDLNTFVGGGTVTNIPAGGNTNDVLAKNSGTDFDVKWTSEAADLVAGTNIAITGTSPATIATIATPTFTSVNKVALTAPASAATLTIANNKTLTANNSLTLAGTDATTLTFQGTDTYVGRATADVFTNKTFNTASAGNILSINGQAITAVSGPSGTVATSGTATNATIPRWVSGVLNTGAITDDGTNIIVPGNAQIPTISGGSAAGSTLSIKSTTNASPSGDVVTVQGQTITLTGKSGLGTAVNIGTTGSSGVTGIAIAGASGGATTIVPTASASGTLTLPAATDTLIGKATTDTLTNKTYDTAGTGNAFKVNGTTVTTASNILDTISSTQGTILYRNASNWITLAPGTSGQFLQTLGPAANPIWQTGSGATTSGNRTLIATLTASSSQPADTTSLTSTYSRYELVFESIVPVDNACIIRLKVNSGGVQSTSYLASTMRMSTAASALGTETTYIPVSARDAGVMSSTASNGGLNGVLTVYDPSNTSHIKHWRGVMIQYDTGAANLAGVETYGAWNGGNGAITGFTLSTSGASGNIASGTVKIFGIVN